jgi:ribosomal protein S18 acetylase RimI-like enzyme
LYRECTRWHVELGWDLARDWAAVDPARQTGQLPGWVARDIDGRARGCAFGVDGPAGRQIAAVIAGDRASAEGLFHAAIHDGEPGGILAFVRTDAVVTADVWRAHGFAVQPYAYLVAPTVARPALGSSWEASDRLATAQLLERAYATDTTLRPFARRGTPDEWLDYLDALTLRPGCGVFSPAASVVLRTGDEVIGVALVTAIGATTAHLAQLAVTPEARGRGWAARLVAAARANAARVLGASRLSLLVSSANTPALTVYRRAGFVHAGDFLTASFGNSPA